jgi:predicted nucleic acid-binding protein
VILVDTSVWVDHLRRGNPQMVRLLELNMVFLHPWVIGELACGNLKNRADLLEHLSNLMQVTQASDSEVMEFIERNRLYGRGVGWIDLHLLASALIANCPFWTLDRRLSEVASDLDVSFTPAAASA